MEDKWGSTYLSTFMSRSLTRLRNAVSRYRKGSFAAPDPNRSPARNAETVYIDVPSPDAIAILCQPTGSEQLDFIHSIIIDLIQMGLLKAVRTGNGDSAIGYLATEAGNRYVQEHLGLAVDAFLNGIFNDNRYS